MQVAHFAVMVAHFCRNNHSTIYAEKLIYLIKDRVHTISKNPNAFKATTFPDVRVSAIGHFSIYYKAIEMELIIVAFWDNRQDLKKLLERLNSPKDQFK